jgi:glutaredoxin
MPKFARPAALTLWLVLQVLPSLAQYKVVQPDGSVTYTDRPPNTPNARITPLGRYGTPANPDSGLPIELRQAVQRYPVVLYTTADCAPCDSGRKLLQQRGVPYSERRVSGEEDAAALERAVGGRTVPALTIGAQPLRGLSETDWMAFLDAAGYPRESKLPRGWSVPEPTALTERSAPARAAPPSEPRAAEPAAPAASGALRF